MTNHPAQIKPTENGDIMVVVHNRNRAGVAELRFDRSAPLGSRWKVVNVFAHRPMTRKERRHMSAQPCVYTGHPHCYVAHWGAMEEASQRALERSMDDLIEYLYDVCKIA